MINKFLTRYLYSSVHISFIAGIYCILVSNQKDALKNFGLGFLTTFIYYNISRIVRIKDYDKTENNPHLFWISNNLTELIFALGFSVLILLIWIHFSIYSNMVFGLVLGIIYILFRKKIFIKNIIISIAWYVLPILYTDILIHVNRDMVIKLCFFLFLSLWYDLKDKEDNELLLKKGESFYYTLLFGLLGCNTALFYSQTNVLKATIFFILFYIGIIYIKKINKYLVYMFIIDSLILAPFIIKML